VTKLYHAAVAKDWPNLFVVGVGKGGTSSLCAYLGQHDDVFMSPVKEPHFFSDADPDLVRAVKDEEAYLRLFEAADSEKFRGEGSVSYFWDAASAAAIRRASPDARIIVSLRDPIDRAYSHYWDTVRYGREDRSFRRAVDEELSGLLPPGREPYLRRSLYCESLCRFISEFGTKVFVVYFEDLTHDSRGELRRIFEFLEIDPDVADCVNLDIRNPFALPRNRAARTIISSASLRALARPLVQRRLRSRLEGMLLRTAEKPCIDAELIPVLTDYFAADRLALEDLLGQQVPWHGSLAADD
jgi:Sulfotransferase family